MYVEKNIKEWRYDQEMAMEIAIKTEVRASFKPSQQDAKHK